MCDGPIVDFSSVPKTEVKKSFLTKFFKNFWERITYYPVITDLDQSKVNMCLKCGDLKINDVWLKIPHPQKPIINKEIEAGRISINGNLTVCDFCVSMEKVGKKMRKNIYKDKPYYFEPDMVLPVSSMSF